MKEQELKEKLIYAYWFHGMMAFLGNKKLWEISENIGMPEQIYGCDKKSLDQFLTIKQWESFEKSRQTWKPGEKWEEMEKAGIRFLPFFHEDYPDPLKNIPDPPWAVYVKGKLPDAGRPKIAIVGARQCSEYGRSMAKRIGRLLGENNIPVISGMARGIDGIGQREALEAGGESFAVLGSGADICYPKENRDLYIRLEKQGGIISEYPPGTAPVARNFPPRNRIISGLCDALIVVEAKEKSGTLITVDMALEQGKEVFAIPGRMTDALSTGCNHLIRQGAEILISPEDILRYIGIEKTQNKKQMLPNETAVFRSKEEKEIYEILDYIPKSLEQIWSEYGCDVINMQLLMKRLLELCVKGMAAQVGGCYYRL